MHKGSATGKMITTGISAVGKQRKVEWLDRIFAQLQQPALAAKIVPNLCTALITGFGRCDNLARVRDVLDFARERGVLNTIVYSSAIAAAAASTRRLAPDNPARRAHAESAADLTQLVLAEMEAAGWEFDRERTASAMWMLQFAGRQRQARNLFGADRGGASGKALDSSLSMAAQCGDAEMALELLAKLGDGATVMSYNRALSAVATQHLRELNARSKAAESGGVSVATMDCVGITIEILDEMKRRGIDKNSMTDSCLWKIFADSPLAEDLIPKEKEREAVAATEGARRGKLYAGKVPHMPVRITNLRDQTRFSVPILLRHELSIACDRIRGGYGGGWKIVARMRGKQAAAFGDGKARELSEGTQGVAKGIVRDLAETFLRDQGIRFQGDSPWELYVPQTELVRLQLEEDDQREGSRVARGTVARMCLAATALGVVALGPFMKRAVANASI